MLVPQILDALFMLALTPLIAVACFLVACFVVWFWSKW